MTVSTDAWLALRHERTAFLGPEAEVRAQKTIGTTAKTPTKGMDRDHRG